MEDIKVYSIEDVASILKVTKKTIYNYIHDGRMQAVKIGKYWRVPASSLEQLING